MSARTRSEHMRWSKDRALDLVDAGDLFGALASMCSDLSKHPETGGMVGFALLTGPGALSSGADPLRSWIEGFA
jgi:hypothetical protein